MICPTCEADNLPGSEHCWRCLSDLTQLDQPTARDRVERSLMEDPVSVLNPRPAVRVAPEATLRQVMDTMQAENVGAVVVVDAAGAMLGIFTERDLLVKVAGIVPDYADRPVRDFMTRKTETVLST